MYGIGIKCHKKSTKNNNKNRYVFFFLKQRRRRRSRQTNHKKTSRWSKKMRNELFMLLRKVALIVCEWVGILWISSYRPRNCVVCRVICLACFALHRQLYVLANPLILEKNFFLLRSFCFISAVQIAKCWAYAPVQTGHTLPHRHTPCAHRENERKTREQRWNRHQLY